MPKEADDQSKKIPASRPKRGSSKKKTPERHRLHDLCHNGKLKQVKELLLKDPTAINMINEPAGVFGYTPMHEATSSRRADILEQLLIHGGDVNALSNGRYTPLHIAASIGDVDCTKILLRYDADISKIDEFGKTPYETAELNRRIKAARMLKTAEVKVKAAEDDPHLGKMIENLTCGKDIDEHCFEEALEIAVAKNRHKAAGFLILQGASNLLQCLQDALMKPFCYKTAVLLLLCHAAKTGDIEIINLMCSKEPPDILKRESSSPVHVKSDSGKEVKREYLPKEWDRKLPLHVLEDLRDAAREVDMAFPVSIAVNEARFASAKIIVFESYCSMGKGEADWHGLALSVIQHTWIDEIINFRKLMVSHNTLKELPDSVTKMKNLLRLDVSHNNLTEIPKELFELPLLRNLNVSFNYLEELPEVTAGEWSNSIKILNVRANTLKTLPGTIADSCIEDLNLADNSLYHVPPSVCHVKTLTNLDISRNRYITVLPPDLGKLSKLTTLGLKGMDQVTDPPPGLREPTTSLIRHLRAKLRNSEAYYTMKLMLVGLANQGKTTLMHRLNKDYKFKDNTSTSGVDIKEINIHMRAQPFTFMCWDFAGQEEYYATHQCFLSQRSLYLLIWDVTKGEQGVASLKPWLDNLETRVPNSTVIIVGTHYDKIPKEQIDDGYETRMLEKVWELAKSYKKLKFAENDRNQIIGFIIVSSNPEFKECQRRIEELRSLVYTVAESLTVDGNPNGPKIMGDQIPSSYLSLARIIAEKQKELQDAKKIPILRKEEFEQMVIENARKNPKDIFDPEDVDIATKFLHDIGLILHYNDPNQDLKDLYFISPSWLCQLMAKIVTVKQGHAFFRKGILNTDVIPIIIGKDNETFQQKFYPQYMRLLFRFQIACQVDSTRILVPSMLPADSPDDLEEEDPESLLHRLHSFTCIPQGFWSRFIGRLLMYLPDMLNAPKGNPEVSLDAPSRHDHISSEGNHGDITQYARTSSSESASLQNGEFGQQNGFGTSPAREEIGVRRALNLSKLLQNSPKSSDSENSIVQRFNDPDALAFIVNSTLVTNISTSHSSADTPTSEMFTSRETTPCLPDSSSTSSLTSATESPVSFTEAKDSSASVCAITDSGTTTPTDLTPIPNGELTSKSESEKTECDGLSVKSESFGKVPQAHRLQEHVIGVKISDEDQHSEDSECEDCEQFKDSVDISSLLDNGILKCWQAGVVFKHPDISFSVLMAPSSEEGREVIETKVSKSILGYRVLGFIVDHIRTLVKEWYPGLMGDDGRVPYIKQAVPCPVCITSNIKPPYKFDIGKCLQLGQTQDFILCSHSHVPQVVDLRKICPDIMFRDLDRSLLLNSTELSYTEADDHLLGEGQFGKVYRGTYKSIDAAIKFYNFEVNDSDIMTVLDNFYDVRQEVTILSKVKRHPYIVSFLGVCVRPKLCSVMEKASKGTLRTFLHCRNDDDTPIPRIVIYRMAQQIASALHFLHGLSIVYRDLKSDNILLFSLDPASDVNVKLTDFGTANFANYTGLKFVIGTKGFVAPEMLDYSNTDEYTVNVDIYSYAMVLYELITKRRPFHNIDSEVVLNTMVREGKRPAFEDVKASSYGYLTLTELMIKSWDGDAKARPSSACISKQLESPAFCLLLGKRPLDSSQSPRDICAMTNQNEIWVACDDRKGASIAIADMKTSEIKSTVSPMQSKYKGGNFNIVGLDVLDSQHVVTVLRSTNDSIVIYSAEKKKTSESFTLPDMYVRSLVSSSNYVFLGLQDGSFVRYAKNHFIKGRLRDKNIVEINKNRYVSSLCASADLKLLVSNDKYVYEYPLAAPDLNRIKCNSRNIGCGEYHVDTMKLSNNCDVLYVSYIGGCPILKCIDTETLEEVGVINCAEIVKTLKPNCDRNDERITCYCPINDTLWVGTGSGHILIFETVPGKNPELITSMHPYKWEVRCLVAYKKGLGPCEMTSDIVVSSGKELDPNGLSNTGDSVCALTEAFPVDLAYRSNSPSSLKSESQNTAAAKVLLFWEAAPAKVLKKLVSVYNETSGI